VNESTQQISWVGLRKAGLFLKVLAWKQFNGILHRFGFAFPGHHFHLGQERN
jgi:hypothetical protein